MNDRLRASLLVLIGSFMIFGCATMRHLLGVVADKPQVRLSNVEVRSVSMKQMDLDFVLEVYNPNSFTLDLQELKYEVQSLDLDLGQGSYKDTISLKAKEKVEVRLPFKVDPSHLVELMKKYLQNPRELKVQLKADLFLDTAFGKLDMHFQEEKTVMKGFSTQ